MHRRFWPVLVLIVLPIAFAVGADELDLPKKPLPPGVAPPPQPLHKVGDHWTPYEPPTELPEGATVHVIEPGDTLWDLAQEYLGDPYLWPQIWERNPYIKDSHWIYPGDPLVIDIAVQPTEVVEEIEEEPAVEPEPMPTEELGPAKAPFPLGTSQDVYCFVKLYPEEVEFPFEIASAELHEYQDDFSVGDIVYLDGGVSEGVAAGDRFFVLEPWAEGGVSCSWSRRLYHPVSGADLGIVYRQVGQVKVICAQEHTAIAEITAACDPISIGDVLEPFEPVPVPLVTYPDPTQRCDLPNGKLTGYITYLKDDVTNGGPGSLILLDVGEADGIYPGQFATVFRDNEVEGYPRLVVGEVGVLTTGDHYATAIITRGWAPFHVGDRIELK